MNTKKKLKFAAVLFFMTLNLILNTWSQTAANQNKKPVRFNPWSLIIYRPDEKGAINEIRTYLKITDLEGNDVTKTAAKASYEWISDHRTLYPYKNLYYLSGGMAMHLNLKPGKYNFSFYTPYEQLKNYSGSLNFTPEENVDWESNIFTYNTENPTYAIFLYPGANENGFYDGTWILDWKAPKYYQWTKPKMR